MNKAQVTETLEPIVDRLKSSANVECVFGKPFESYGKLYVPVATFHYGFGGGGHDDGEPKDGHGGGLGGGVKSKPAGVLEITPQGARFIRFEPSWRQIVAAGAGIWLLTRLLSSLRHG